MLGSLPLFQGFLLHTGATSTSTEPLLLLNLPFINFNFPFLPAKREKLIWFIVVLTGEERERKAKKSLKIACTLHIDQPLLNCTIGCHRRNRYFHEWMGTISTHTTAFKGSSLTELICLVMNTIDAELSADNGKRHGPRVSHCNLVSASIASLVAPLQPYFGSPRFVSYSARVSACKFVALARQLDSARLTTLALENKFHFLSFFIADILSCFYCVYIFKSIFPSALLIFFSGDSFSCIIPS